MSSDEQSISRLTKPRTQMPRGRLRQCGSWTAEFSAPAAGIAAPPDWEVLDEDEFSTSSTPVRTDWPPPRQLGIPGAFGRSHRSYRAISRAFISCLALRDVRSRF